MEIDLDQDELELIKTLNEALQREVKNIETFQKLAADRRRSLDKYAQQVTELKGVTKTEFNTKDWVVDIGTSKIILTNKPPAEAPK